MCVSNALERQSLLRTRSDERGEVKRTVFALDVSQELRHPPLQDDHLNWWYSLGLQTTINPFQQPMLFVRRYQYPSRPFFMSVSELFRFVLRYELLRQPSARFVTTLCDLHRIDPTALYYAPQRLEPH